MKAAGASVCSNPPLMGKPKEEERNLTDLESVLGPLVCRSLQELVQVVLLPTDRSCPVNNNCHVSQECSNTECSLGRHPAFNKCVDG